MIKKIQIVIVTVFWILGTIIILSLGILNIKNLENIKEISNTQFSSLSEEKKFEPQESDSKLIIEDEIIKKIEDTKVLTISAISIFTVISIIILAVLAAFIIVRIFMNKDKDKAKDEAIAFLNSLADKFEVVILRNIKNIEMEIYGFIKNEEEFNWDSVGDLDEETYEEPEHKMFECPYCHHVDRDIHFKKV